MCARAKGPDLVVSCLIPDIARVLAVLVSSIKGEWLSVGHADAPIDGCRIAMNFRYYFFIEVWACGVVTEVVTVIANSYLFSRSVRKLFSALLQATLPWCGRKLLVPHLSTPQSVGHLFRDQFDSPFLRR